MSRLWIFMVAWAALCAGCVLDWDRRWDQGPGRDAVAGPDLPRLDRGPTNDQQNVDLKVPPSPHNWAVLLGAETSASLGRVAVDKAGNIYASGTFSGKLTNPKATLTSQKDDVLVTRLSPQGTIDWTISGSSAELDRSGGLFVTSSGGLYVTGLFNKTFTLGTMEVTSVQGTDIFVARLSPQGEPKWLTRFGDNASCGGHGVALDSARGELWVTGSFGYITNFGSFKLSASGGSVDIFVARLKASGGEVIGVDRAGGTKDEHSAGVVLDSAGNAYIAGGFRNTADFGSHTLTAGAKSTDTEKVSNVFAARVSAKDHSFAWATGGISTKEARAMDLAVDGSGNLYITGYFSGKITFGSTTLTCQGASDVFVVKLDSAGKVLWAQDTDGAGFELASALALDAAGNVLVTGYHEGPTSIGGKALPGSGKRDVFLAMFGSNSKALWVSSHGGAGVDWGLGVAVDSKGQAVVVGYIDGTATLGKHTVTAKVMDAFVWKFSPTMAGPR